MNQELFSYIAACPTAFQAVAHTALLLEGEGDVRLLSLTRVLRQGGAV